jgi:hypothetical protein
LRFQLLRGFGVVSLNVTLVKALGEAPGVMTRLGGQIGKIERGRIVARDRVKKVYLNLRQIIKAIIENLTKLLQASRCRNLFGGSAVQVGLLGDFLSAAKLLKGSQ